MLLVAPGDEEVEEGDDGALEFGSAAGVDGGRREGLPDDALANVGGDEERDTGAQAVALLEELIEENDDETGNNELQNEEEADTRAEVAGLAVETGQDVDGSLAEGKNDSENYTPGQFLAGVSGSKKTHASERFGKVHGPT